MAWDRKRLEEDLRGLLDGEVFFDPSFASLYSCDAGIHQLQPLGVVRPRGLQDVVRCVEYAAEHEIPLHPRGAGSGVSGESLGQGLIVDFSRYLRRVETTGADEVTAQPGAVLAHANREAAKKGRRIGPDPATESVSTIGGLVGRNGSGSRFLAYGSMRDSVLSLQVVLADGRVVEVGRGAQPTSLEAVSGVDDLSRRLQHVLGARSDDTDVSFSHIPRSLRPGYCLAEGDTFDGASLADLIVGSEGTLGLVTEVRLRTFPVPASVGVALISFNRLRDAAAAVQRIREYSISACDLLDRRLLTLAQETTPELSHWVEPHAEALLLVEVAGDASSDVREQLERLVRKATRKDHLAGPPRLTLEPDEVALAWKLAKRVVPRLMRLRGKARPIPFMEDVWVPPEKLPVLIERAQKILRDAGVVASVYAHAAHGELHLRPLLDLSDPNHQRLLPSLAEDYFDCAVELGGMVSVEHAWGLSRSWYLRHRFGAWHARVCEVKRVFDPQRILNPGRLGDPLPPSLGENIRRVSLPAPQLSLEDGEEEVGTTVIDPQLSESVESLLGFTRQCNGCAHCRVDEAGWRMCPLFHGRPREEASPRAKANLLRAVLTGELPPETLRSDEAREIADLCFHCHQCRIECPTEVDVPRIVVEWKAAHVAANGMRLRDWWLAQPERYARLGQRWVGLANFILQNRQARWFLERLTGIAAGRKLPRLAPLPFLKIAQRQRLGRADRGAHRKVAYFVDVYANWFDVELAQATVAVLRHNGFSVLVPSNQQPSGMPLVVAGSVDVARKEAIKNVRLFAELVRQGYRIVTTEPSAALCIAHEYPRLLPDDDEARLVAQHTWDAGSLLWQEHLQGRLELDFRPVHARLVYHTPCHLRALPGGVPGQRLLELVPGLRVSDAEAGCSGMAGMYGVKREHYRNSLRLGLELIASVGSQEIHGGTTECSACKLQMEHRGEKPTVHPIKILAWAYEAMHFEDNPLSRVSQPLTVT